MKCCPRGIGGCVGGWGQPGTGGASKRTLGGPAGDGTGSPGLEGASRAEGGGAVRSGVRLLAGAAARSGVRLRAAGLRRARRRSPARNPTPAGLSCIARAASPP
eukprot:7431990-Pyramimonas_sp.AAC.1